MYVKLLKPLNPKAKEWRPTPPRPHQIFYPHSLLPAAPPPLPQAVLVVAVTPTPTHNLFSQLPTEHPHFYRHLNPSCHFLHPHSTYTQHHPFRYVSFLADQSCDKAAEAAGPISEGEKEDLRCGNELSDLQLENEKNDEESPTKGLKSPHVDVFRNGVRRVIAPRLQRSARNSRVGKKPPPPPPPPKKQIWFPKKSSTDLDIKVSGVCGAPHSRPPIVHLPLLSTANSSQSSNTTVMIKNIPNGLGRDFMLKFLDGYCKVHSLEYDLLYLPMDFRRKYNLGYAFVNFTTADAAMKFKKILQNFKWKVVYTDEGTIYSRKICEITWANIQGKKAMVQRLQNTSFTCDDWDFLPVILDPPRNGSDPNPPPPVIVGELQAPC